MSRRSRFNAEIAQRQTDTVQIQRDNAFQTPSSVIDTSGIQEGENLIKLGQNIGEVANILKPITAAAKEFRLKEDNRLTGDLFSKMEQEVNSNMASLLTLKSHNAIADPTDPEFLDKTKNHGVAMAGEDAFKEIWERYSEDLTQQQTYLLGERYREISFSNHDQLVFHEAEQRLVADADVRKSEIALQERQAVNMHAVRKDMERHLALANMITLEDPTKGIQEKLNEVELRKERVYSQVIEAISVQDHGRALSMLEEQRGITIGEAEYGDLLESVNRKRTNHKAPAIVFELMSRTNLDPTEVDPDKMSVGDALDEIRENYAHDKTLAIAAMDLFRIQVGKVKEDLEMEDWHMSQTLRLKAEDALAAGDPNAAVAVFTQADSNVPDEIRQNGIDMVEGVVSGKRTVTDEDFKYELRMQAYEDPDAFRKLKLHEYGKLNSDDLKMFERMQLQIQQGESPPRMKDTYTRLQRVDQVVEDYITKGKSRAGLSEKQRRERTNLRARVEDGVEHYYKEHGTDPVGKDLEAILDRTVAVIDVGFFSDTRAFEADDDDLSLFDHKDIESTSQIPRQYLQRIFVQWTKSKDYVRGEAPDDDTVVNIFRDLIQRYKAAN